MKSRYAFSIFIVMLILSSLACTVFVGGPDYSNLAPIPVSSSDAQALKDQVRQALEAGATTGVVTITITEAQITSTIAERLQADAGSQADQTPILTDPQVYLRDGQMKIYGKTQRGMLAANIGIIINIGIDELGKPKIEIASADFGPFPAPDTLKETLTALIDEAYTGSLGPAATGLRIETIVIADGIMTISGRIK
jgi:hypothetical protein